MEKKSLSTYGLSWRSRSLVISLTLARCFDMVRLLGRVRASANVFATIARVLPAIKGQALVIFTTFHVFAWIGMVAWGGAIYKGNTPAAWDGRLYIKIHLINFFFSCSFFFFLHVSVCFSTHAHTHAVCLSLVRAALHT
jgi:hypothetical protein